MKIKKDIEVYSDEFWYDVTDGGYTKYIQKATKNKKSY